MPQNAIQFQKGLSEPAFASLYGSEELCVAAVERMRLPEGFVCPDLWSRRRPSAPLCQGSCPLPYPSILPEQGARENQSWATRLNVSRRS